MKTSRDKQASIASYRIQTRLNSQVPRLYKATKSAVGPNPFLANNAQVNPAAMRAQGLAQAASYAEDGGCES